MTETAKFDSVITFTTQEKIIDESLTKFWHDFPFLSALLPKSGKAANICGLPCPNRAKPPTFVDSLAQIGQSRQHLWTPLPKLGKAANICGLSCPNRAKPPTFVDSLAQIGQSRQHLQGYVKVLWKTTPKTLGAHRNSYSKKISINFDK
jgi:hypothetical protein